MQYAAKVLAVSGALWLEHCGQRCVVATGASVVWRTKRLPRPEPGEKILRTDFKGQSHIRGPWVYGQDGTEMRMSFLEATRPDLTGGPTSRRPTGTSPRLLSAE